MDGGRSDNKEGGLKERGGYMFQMIEIHKERIWSWNIEKEVEGEERSVNRNEGNLKMKRA